MADSSPSCRHENPVQPANIIGKVFAGYSEAYIAQYRPDLRGIKLIRNIRKCRTAAMGAVLIVCKGCGCYTRIYKSCGDSKCPICQGVKRLQAQDKISARMLAVPYVHTTFTLPHELNPLLRCNQKALYSLLYRSAWKTIKTLCANPKNLGGLPGMIALMHTWGSDMKYHVHLHTLITFGGLDDEGNWQYPKRKNKLARFRDINKLFRENYINGIEKLRKKGELIEVPFLDEILVEITKKSWCVNNGIPHLDTQRIEDYLSRYIMKIAISNSRLEWDDIQQQVHLIYNDYRHQKAGEAAPKKVKILDPMSFIHQFLQHQPPRYFQRTRYYGLHHPASYKKRAAQIPEKLKRNGKTVRTLIQIITALLKAELLTCQACGGTDFDKEIEAPDDAFLAQYVKGYKPKGRAPPIVEPIEHTNPSATKQISPLKWIGKEKPFAQSKPERGIQLNLC